MSAGLSFASLFDGARCEDCGCIEKIGYLPYDNGGLFCLNPKCMSYSLTHVHLCTKCGEAEALHAGECVDCHVHKFEDGVCECGAEEVVHRDQVQPARSLVQP